MEEYRIDTMNELAAVADSLYSQMATDTPHEGACVLGLSGELGTGKTTFVQTLAQKLGVVEVVTSPTFTIMQRYDTTDPVFTTLIHIDAYRIESIDEMQILGFADMLAQNDTIICIEWPERIASLVPDHTITLSFTFTGDTRRLTVSYE